jgi:hypothetical protein
VPPLIAVFEPPGAAVPLQCDTQVIWPDGHAEFSRQVAENLVRGRPLRMRLDCLQGGIAQGHAGRLLSAACSALPAGWRCSSGRASTPPPLGRGAAAPESRQDAFSDFQFIELVCELCTFGIYPRQTLGNPLLFLPNLFQRRHLPSPPSPNTNPQDNILPLFSDK